MDSLLKGWGLDRVSKEQELFNVWDKAVGEPISKCTRPVAVHNGRLVVAVKDSAWMQELSFMKRDIKRKLNRVLGRDVVREIRFKQGMWQEEPGEPEEKGREDEEETELDQSVIEEARRAASVIADPRLREQVLRTLLKSAGRARE